MKKTIGLIALAALITVNLYAETNVPAPFIKGTLDINFKTRTDVDSKGAPNTGVTDVYKLNINVADRALFNGDITHTPTILSSVFGREQQAGKLDYRLTCSLINPKNPKDAPRAVGRLTGIVQIDKNGVYRFSDGTLRMGIDAAGQAAGFERKFSGIAKGRPPKSDSLVARAKKEAVRISRDVQGKKASIVVTDYDKMEFQGHVLAAGPVQAYPDAQVNGEMLYDYERFAWYFRNVSISYALDGKTLTDKLTGNIRWVESPQRKTNGEGEYQFDVRVNEPELKATEVEAFAPASDESAFFESNPSLSSLVGTMKYKDALSGETVTQSAVTVDLKGNNLNRQQVMNLCKLILISSIVPVNAE